MNQGRLTGLLVGPSLFSLSISSLLALTILAVSNWSYITPENPLYNYLFGTYGLTTVLQNSSNALSAINGVFSSPLAYNIAVGVFALFIGLLVYVFLEGIDHITTKAKDEVHEVAYVSDAAVKKAMKREVEVRAGLRIATLIVWICYLIFFARVIVPYCILLGRIDTGHLWTLSNVGSGIAAFALLLISLHVQAIFMRLLVLRPRLIGSENIAVSRGGH